KNPKGDLLRSFGHIENYIALPPIARVLNRAVLHIIKRERFGHLRAWHWRPIDAHPNSGPIADSFRPHVAREADPFASIIIGFELLHQRSKSAWVRNNAAQTCARFAAMPNLGI